MPDESHQPPSESKYARRSRGGNYPPTPDGFTRRPHAITARPETHQRFADLLPLQRGKLVARALLGVPYRQPATTIRKGRIGRVRSDGTMGERNPRVEVTFSSPTLSHRLYPLLRSGGAPDFIRRALDALFDPDMEQASDNLVALRLEASRLRDDWERYVSDVRNGG